MAYPNFIVSDHYEDPIDFLLATLLSYFGDPAAPTSHALLLLENYFSDTPFLPLNSAPQSR